MAELDGVSKLTHGLMERGQFRQNAVVIPLQYPGWHGSKWPTFCLAQYAQPRADRL